MHFFSYFMGFCNPLLKPGLLIILDCTSYFKVPHKKDLKNFIFSWPIANLCDLLKLVNFLFEIKLIFFPPSSATIAGRFPPSYVRNRMQQSEKWHKIEEWSTPFFPDSTPCDSYANRSPFSPPFVLIHRGFRRPTRLREGGGAIALREKSCAEFSNKYFAYFKRSQRLAIGLNKMLIFSLFYFIF